MKCEVKACIFPVNREGLCLLHLRWSLMEDSLLGTSLSGDEFAFSGFRIIDRRGYGARSRLDNRMRWARRRRKLERDPAALLIFRERQRINYRRWYAAIRGTERYRNIIERHRRDRSKTVKRSGSEMAWSLW